ncbi:MAG: hypothetical protein NWE96_07305 [Candidatus Bathyarchaeota archaeon]|nr:hypothetical protein [Candidatus Bathyarchaeota archaeon]
MIEARRLNDSIKKEIINYVVTRQNEDGGYCFAQGALESNGQDTYYGLSILKQLSASFPNPEKTKRFLEENRVNSIHSMYYTAQAQLLLGVGINGELKENITRMLGSLKYFGSQTFFSDSSEFETTFMALQLARLLKIGVDKIGVTSWLNSFQNEDGGFGPYNHSNIDSTYHAIACLTLLDMKPNKQVVLGFVRSCEKPYGGFTAIPINFTPYIEYTYYGVMALELLNEKSRYPIQTADWVLSCQRRSGGFARSDLGIATFVDTYYAIQTLEKLKPLQD